MLKRQEVERVIQKYRFETLKQIIIKEPEFWQTITGIKIAITQDSEKKTKNFRCVYMHHTDYLNVNDYLPDGEEHDDSATDEAKDTKLEFSYIDENFYIAGSKNIQVYLRKDIPIAFNYNYEAKLDEYEQSSLLERYSENKNVPEWFAIAFFRAIKLGLIKITSLINELHFD